MRSVVDEGRRRGVIWDMCMTQVGIPDFEHNTIVPQYGAPEAIFLRPKSVRLYVTGTKVESVFNATSVVESADDKGYSTLAVDTKEGHTWIRGG